MNILILGSGGREHAFALKLSKSNKVSQLFVAPGNAGTAQIAKNVAISPTDFKAVKACVLDNEIKMVIVGPEAPLVAGVHDFFLSDEDLKAIPVIGPKKDGALLEGSKDFSKQFMLKHGIPTAKYQSFTKDTLTEGKAFLETLTPPFVLKADGLAAGKGVLILNNIIEAKSELEEMLTNEKFGAASATVVIEEFLQGIELSVFVLTDGKSYKILPSAKDYKRIGEGDQGLNTGGMGAISPVPFADLSFLQKVEELVVKPTINGLQKDAIDYRGFIFIGLMNDNGNPSVVEYNVRMGDPETEVVLPRIESDLYDLFEGVAEQTLHTKEIKISGKTATTVMLVSGGYPEAYEKGKEIAGLKGVQDAITYHAGTTLKNDKVYTNGGRVMAITGLGDTIQEALDVSYSNIEKIRFDGMNFRKDIGFDVMARCIPIIKLLLENDYEPVIASDGSALLLLRKEFPKLENIELPSYNIQYAKNLKWSLFFQAPKIFIAVRKEKQTITTYILKNKVVGIISDNRFGVRSAEVPSVYITHQINVLSGIFTSITSKIHQKIIRKFDECWVPDIEISPSFSGKLSQVKKNGIELKRIGILSRFQKEKKPFNIDVLIVLSGPEPHRTALESKLLQEFKSSGKQVVLVQGIISEKQVISKKGTIEIYNFMLSKELQDAINSAELVVGRSGYSSILDLAKLNKKAFFIPTPGQTEQEYLAKYLASKEIAPFVKQRKFKAAMIEKVKQYKGFDGNYTSLESSLFNLFEGK